MLQQRVYQNRADRVIALGRAVLAGFASLAVVVDPPTSSAVFSAPLIEIYFGLSILFGLFVARRSAAALPLGAYAMASDIAVFTVLLYTSANGSSPFFPMLLFIIMSATLKWQWRGAAAVGATVLLLFLPTGFSLRMFGPSPDDQTMRFVMRAGNLLVMSGLLIFFGRQRERVWEELLRLSTPIRGGAAPGELPVEACLTHAATFFGAPRALLLWESSEEPGVNGAEWHDGKVAALDVGAALQPVIDPGAGDSAFLFGGDGETRFYDDSRGLRPAADSPLSAAARALWQLDAGVAAPVRCEEISGWLIVPGATRDEDLYLARAVAAQLALALDRADADRAWRQAAAGEERVRLARDLHDGILQFLAGLSLQLRIIERDAASDLPAFRERVERIQASLLAEQRELRGFVQGMATPRGGGDAPAAEIKRLARLLAYHWDIEIAVHIEDGFAVGELAGDVRQIVREAVANAVRHGGATRVEIRGRIDADGIGLDIADNGGGLARRGRFDLHRMAAENIGPRSLRARVSSLGGALTADSRGDGLTLAVDLPVRLREAAE